MPLALRPVAFQRATGLIRWFGAAAIVTYLCAPSASAQGEAPSVPESSGAPRATPVASAIRATVTPKLDGRLDDAVWTAGSAIENFTQQDPTEGAPGSERTRVRIAYDDEAIYVGARLDDSGQVTTRLGRRDMTLAGSDWLRISFDSYHDRRGAFRFDVNPDGVRRDATLVGTAGTGGTGGATASAGTTGGGSSNPLGGPEGDLAWDAVWDAVTTVDGTGWTVEVRIPFSQLRFSTADEQVWGFQVERIIARKQEFTQFSFRPKAESGGVVGFGDLTGLRGIKPGRPLELVPYALANLDRVNATGNPFRGNTDLGGNAGLDVRYRLSSSLIVSATANPDFGQVEVDPAIINLSAFEVRLDEKRPFFVEGANNFRFGVNTQGPGANAASLLYSRRVGRPPQIGVGSTPSDVPGSARILGAVKLSGKTSSGWSIGALDAVTSDEQGRYLDSGGVTQQRTVEPRTNYVATRINKEFRKGLTTLGGVASGVTRSMADPAAAAALRSGAYTGGLDFGHEWAKRAWNIGIFAVGSRVSGSTAAILATQKSSSRYYQRPDSRKLHLDPSATSLTGYASTVQLRKVSGAHWTGDGWVGVISPGFEINDAGFLQRGDRVATGGAIRYSVRTPGFFYRNWSVNLVQNHTTNYDGDWIEKILRPSGQITFRNYWTASFNSNFDREHMDDRLTRGGPLAIKPSSWSTSYTVGTDPRKSLVGTFDTSAGGDRVGSRTRGAGALLEVRTSPQWNFSFGPRWTRTIQDAQYVATVTDASAVNTYGARYIFANLRQTEVSLVTRLNYTFTPNLTLELYLQPLVSHGDYGTPKEFMRPRGYAFGVYGRDLGTIARSGSTFTVDPDGVGPSASFAVADRTFTARSLRGNAVLRWEYRAGSTLYLVWQQERLNNGAMDDFAVGRAIGSLLDGDGHNVLVVKWSYRIN